MDINLTEADQTDLLNLCEDNDNMRIAINEFLKGLEDEQLKE